MYRSLMILLVLSALAVSQSQPPNKWANWEPFLGHWSGTGSGEPGQGAGEFSFGPELQGTVLARQSYAEYPATKDRPAYRHDDLMVIYSTPDHKTLADYWDNEGHVIRYDVDVLEGKLVFVSDAAQPGPRFRLIYVKTGDNTLKLTFAIAPPTDRDNFKTFIEATAQRKAEASRSGTR
jgi:hypothetical protein